MSITSKLPAVGLTIFTEMMNLASACSAINLSQGFPEFDPHPEYLVFSVNTPIQHADAEFMRDQSHWASLTSFYHRLCRIDAGAKS